MLSAISCQLSLGSPLLAGIGDAINRVCTTFLLPAYCPMATENCALLHAPCPLYLANGSRQTLILGPCRHTT